MSDLAQLIATAAAQQRRRQSDQGEDGVPRQLKLKVDQDNAFVQVRCHFLFHVLFVEGSETVAATAVCVFSPPLLSALRTDALPRAHPLAPFPSFLLFLFVPPTTLVSSYQVVMVVAEAACQEHKLVLRHSAQVCGELLEALAALAAAAEGDVRVSALRLLAQLAASLTRIARYRKTALLTASVLNRGWRAGAHGDKLLRDCSPVPHFALKLMGLALSADWTGARPLLVPLRDAVAKHAPNDRIARELLAELDR